MAKKNPFGVSKVGFMRRNPTATYEEFRDAVGGTRSSYYVARWAANKKTIKPKKSEMTVKVKAHRRRPHGTVEADMIAEGKLRIIQLEQEVAELKHQIVGFRAVISYLENLADLRSSQ